MSLFQNQEIYTPTNISDKLNAHFSQYFYDILVEGEISSVTKAASGHIYLQLKDQKSILKATIWASQVRLLGTYPVEGMLVVANGNISTYGPRSEYQISIKKLYPKGAGALRQAYEKLKASLTAQGIFAPSRKRSLPRFPQKVALITSAQGAAVEDFIKTALIRYPPAAISLFPAKMQGSGAAEEMKNAIEALNGWGGFDLIVLTRGGGSIEDLWAFNEEPLVLAIAKSRIPVLAAIGHSINLSLSEMAADAKAITPTAAAEAIFPVLKDILKEIQQGEQRMYQALSLNLRTKKELVVALRHNLQPFERRLFTEETRLNDLQERLKKAIHLRLSHFQNQVQIYQEKLKLLSPQKQMERRREELKRLTQAFPSIKERLLARFREDLGHTIDRLQLVSPLGILTRGYGLAIKPDGNVLKNVKDIEIGDPFKLHLGKGTLFATVNAKENSEDKT
ncbi:MAG: exodeoxyribonuclease VII large subunit [Deltaproteobacteria bacterium]|jgi:exodeoxyribonuclease VII large subunit|nr:exodeoxyribonuclease VII large subunit [Deltaproteobacteria bacterium]